MRALKQIGIVGGMGPRATVRFFDMLLKQFQLLRGAQRNSEYPQIHVCSVNSIENVRPLESMDPRRTLIAALADLKRMGAEVVAIPCNSVQSFLLPNDPEIPIDFLSPTIATCNVVRGDHRRDIVLLATRRTVHARLYEKLLSPFGYEIAAPPESVQNEIDNLVDQISGDRDVSGSLSFIQAFVAELPGQAQVVLGCTELSFVADSFSSRVHAVHDSLEILARATFSRATS